MQSVAFLAKSGKRCYTFENIACRTRFFAEGGTAGAGTGAAAYIRNFLHKPAAGQKGRVCNMKHKWMMGLCVVCAAALAMPAADTDGGN